MSKILFSVVCASKNEETHIGDLIETFNKANTGNAELIIVDDSTDKTKEIVKSKLYKNIILIDGENTGCCNARNKGVLNSSGQIITYMTADSIFCLNFFKKIKLYFDKGYDVVMTSSKVLNTENVWARYIDCWSETKIENNSSFSPLTSQGYSVRKSSAISEGLIDAGSKNPNICRDYTLVQKLDTNNYSKIFARDILCYHKAPSSFKEFTINQYTRGIISGGTTIRYSDRGFLISYLRSSAKFFIFLLNIFIPILIIIRAIKMQKFSSSNDIFSFLVIFYYKNLCFILGEFITILKFNLGFYKR